MNDNIPKYEFNALIPPPCSTRGSTTSAAGNSDFISQNKRGIINKN